MRLRSGASIHTTPTSPIIQMLREIFSLHVYDPPFLSIEPEDVVVDIGASIGVFSVYARLKTENRVIAYEPCKYPYEVLMKNINVNHLDIEARRCAVGSEEKLQKLYIAEREGGHSFYGPNISGSFEEYEEVETITLDQLCESHGLNQIDFLKLDCEGAEFDILLSNPSSLERVSKIALEFHDNVSSHDHADLVSLLAKRHFHVQVNKRGISPFGYLYAKNKLMNDTWNKGRQA